MARMTALVAATSVLSCVSADTLRLEIAKNHAVQAQQLARRSLERRGSPLDARSSDTVNVVLDNLVQVGLYAANISVGTPGQSLTVQIDTGSSDLWFPAYNATICTNTTGGPGTGCPGGSFNPSNSNTFSIVEPGGFNISYVDNSGSTGDYIQDTFSIGGATVDNFEMALANSVTGSPNAIGVMGIAYSIDEANVGTGDGSVYSNVPQALVKSGLIKTNAYSLWLDDFQATTGSVLFGGVDTAKYSGDLISVAVQPSDLGNGTIDFNSFNVAFTSLTASSSSGSDVLTPSGFAINAILDSGTTLTLLPDDIASAVYQEVGADNDESAGAVLVPCSLANKNGSLTYGFGGSGGPTVSVVMSQLVEPYTDANGNSADINGETACEFLIQPAGTRPVLFGDSFLRSAYVVYDLINNRIAVAQTKYNTTDSNVVAFASSGAPIPSATSAANDPTITATVVGNPNGLGGSAASATAALSSVSYAPTGTGLNAEAGFTGTGSNTLASSTSSGKKSAGGAGPAPFQWSVAVVGGITILGMGLGGGIFAFL